MDKQEMEKYNWLDAEQHKPQNKSSDGQYLKQIQKILDFIDV